MRKGRAISGGMDGNNQGEVMEGTLTESSLLGEAKGDVAITKEIGITGEIGITAEVNAVPLPGMSQQLANFAKNRVGVPSSMVIAELREGEDALLDRIADDMLEGNDYGQVAMYLGVKTGELARWLFATPEREAAYRGILKIKADMKAHEIIRIADTTSLEDVPISKLRIETNKWAIERWDKKTYGNDKGGEVGGMNVQINFSALDKGVL